MAAGAIGPRIGQTGNHRRSSIWRLERLSLALALSAVVLTACAWDPPTIERTPREAAGAESNAKSRLAARKGVGQNGTAPSGTAGDPLDVPGTEMAALEVDLTNFKERLIGLDSDEINDIMGTPGLERAEPPALIWQYRHQVCTVDIFMFDDGSGAAVDHVEVRPTSGGSVNEKECFTSLLRNVPPSSAARAPGGQPVAPSPSTPVGRRPIPSAAPASGPAQTPSSSRPPVPSTAAPSAAPAMAARPPAAAAPAIPEGEEGPPPGDTDVDFDFGPPPATPGGPAPAAQGRLPSAAPSSEAIPTLPPEIRSSAPPASTGSFGGIEIPPSANVTDDDEFSDPLITTAPPPPSPSQTAKPTPSAATAKPAPTPAPSAAVPSTVPPAPSIAPPPPSAAISPPSLTAKPTPSTTTTNPAPTPAPLAAVPQAMPATVPPAPSIAPPPVAMPAPAAMPAPLAPRAPAATAAAQPKGAPKGAAARQVEDIEDDLPPDLLTGRRDDDPAHNNEDLVE